MKKTAPSSRAAAANSLPQEGKTRDRQRLDRKLCHIRHEIVVMNGTGRLGHPMVSGNRHHIQKIWP